MSIGMAASGTEGPLRSWRNNNLKAIFEGGASLRLQFPKEDLGFVYESPAAATLPDSRMEAWEWQPSAAHKHGLLGSTFM